MCCRPSIYNVVCQIYFNLKIKAHTHTHKRERKGCIPQNFAAPCLNEAAGLVCQLYTVYVY